ncbi:DUF1295 domain-containing protein [Scedosporium apiospermum]|uniref:DUF1295 domain-containing protein n=1 Tax=Pseudallescheria apiosperma TaxID=563466 RepID=A0A084GHR8_PSEDA|nr:DUF1295 domain-containing protein [Scedosporium apiospermum]KEZ46880.1 DUF1295 domain-containing protein [Scedosporium apiospermum]
MALPTLQTIKECADFHKTVEPFLPQLYDLPQKLLDNYSNRDALVQIYLETNPLISGAAFSIFLGVIFLVTAEVNRNFSQVDRAWSILPAVYNVHFAVWARLAVEPHSRTDLVALFSIVWSIRLTYNYWRKGGYQIGSEDYRWAHVQKWMHPVLFSLFDLLFIAFTQSFLIFLFSSAPAYIILLTNKFEPTLSSGDFGYFAVELLLVVSEYFSDGQQWHYQTAKHQYQKDAKLPRGFAQADLDRGFITSGLWAYSRHPNCAAEQLIWFFLYHWSCFSSTALYSWAAVGSFSLIMLFQGSTFLTESISGGKYPEYRHYQDTVGMFLPSSFRPYRAPEVEGPKVIRTSELLKKQKSKQKLGKRE